jgi:hypothetical protein
MNVDFRTAIFAQNNNPITMTSAKASSQKAKDESCEHIVRNNFHTGIAIGALTATTVLITLGVLARKGKFGKSLQSYLGGAKQEAKNPQTITQKTAEVNSNLAGESHFASTANNKPSDVLSTPKPDVKQPELVDKIEPQRQTYSTKLPETIKEYTSKDLDIYGFACGKTFSTKGKTVPSKEMLNRVQNKELTVLYDETNTSTEIILPVANEFFAVKINGIVSKEKAKDIFRTINVNGISDPQQFPQIITAVLNGKLNTKYSAKNIGMYYDFHDKGAWKFDGGGGKGATDGRIMLRRQNPQWKGYSIAYYAPKISRTTTEIGVALPSSGMERALSNHYSIFLDGLIPVGTVNRLIKHLETNVIKNPKDVQYEELAKIQAETIRFLNQN